MIDLFLWNTIVEVMSENGIRDNKEMVQTIYNKLSAQDSWRISHIEDMIMKMR